jgi:hypothetical protein
MFHPDGSTLDKEFVSGTVLDGQFALVAMEPGQFITAKISNSRFSSVRGEILTVDQSSGTCN